MDWEVILKGIGLLLFGTLFVWLGLDGWKHHRMERNSLIEATILKAAKGKDPLPQNRWDRMIAYGQPVLMLIFGPLMILGGVAVLSLLGE